MNIQNQDAKCALYCILAWLFPKYHSNGRRKNKPNAYQVHEKEINVTGIDFPLRIIDVGKLEKLNDLCINIFSLDEKNSNIIPIRISDRELVNRDRVIDLLYIVNGERSHYCLITDLARLCRSQVTSHHGSNFLCRRCLHYCRNEESFRTHMEICLKHDPKMTVYPKKDDAYGRDKVKFTKVARQLPLPFYFTADFECILEKFESDESNTHATESNESKTTFLDRHVPCGAAYKISCTDPRFYRDPAIFTQEVEGKGIIEQFLDSILQDARNIREILRYKAPMKPLTARELTEFDSPLAICHICKKHIQADEIKCKDHDHTTGYYRGPSHQSCNINYQINPDKIQIPCFFHNLKNYDAHLLMSAVKKRHGKITVIPTTHEKYISFSIGDICFKDSYAFTQESLESLAKNLNTEQLINTRKWLEHGTVTWGSPLIHNVTMQDEGGDEEDEGMDNISCIYEDEVEFDESETEEDDEVEYNDDMAEFDYRRDPYVQTIPTRERMDEIEDNLKLLRSKGIYPYEYFDSFERFDESELPPIKAFNSRLNAGSGISEKEYAHAKSVFEHFNMRTLQDYHNLYLIQDVLLLNDVLETFRSICLKTYGLDPLHYHTAPGLTWDAGLKYTDVTLQLITDEEQFLFVESGIRGGISMISHRHAQINSPSMKDLGYYNPKDPLCELSYIDANNLYGFAMMQYLPISDFHWLLREIINEISIDWILGIPDDSEKGYIFEIDGYIPLDKHDKFTNYPIAPEAKQIHGYMLSEYQRNILRKRFSLDGKSTNRLDLDERIDQYISTEKLILDLNPKEKYIVHYRTLKLYIQLGFEVTHIHRVLCFKQKAWLAPYIEANTQMRQKATNDFEKNFFKLMNNAFFGKTMENVRKRRHVDIVDTTEKLKKLVAQPTFHSATSFREDLTAVERMKKKIVMNKPIYIGFCVLEMSKWLMYDFYYNVLCRIFLPDCVKLLFTDTDSLCVSITGYDNIHHKIRNTIIIGEDGQHVPAIDFFDVSGYPSDHCIFDGMSEVEINHLKQKNKKVPGKMKDELDGNIIIEFIGLRAKAYAFKKYITYPTEKQKKGDIEDVKKLKGIQKCVVEKNISFDIYKSSIFDMKTHYAETVTLQSYLHEIRTVAKRKKATGPYDDKRYILENGISSYPYGHYSINRDRLHSE